MALWLLLTAVVSFVVGLVIGLWLATPNDPGTDFPV